MTLANSLLETARVASYVIILLFSSLSLCVPVGLFTQSSTAESR